MELTALLMVLSIKSQLQSIDNYIVFDVFRFKDIDTARYVEDEDDKEDDVFIFD